MKNDCEYLKICKHVTHSPEMYVNRICHQPMKWWHPDCSQRAIRSSREFHSHILFFEVQRAVQMGKTNLKNKRIKKAEPKKGSIIVFGRRFWIVRRIWEVFACFKDHLHFKLVFLISPAIFTLLAPAWVSFVSSLGWSCHELFGQTFYIVIAKQTACKRSKQNHV